MGPLLHRARWPLALIGLVGIAACGWYAVSRANGKSSAHAQAANANEGPADSAISVEVIHPAAGGIVRTCTQPGTVEPFETADLDAKVSGYLVEQSVEIGGKKVPVDIGTPVKAGDVLARIAVPEYEKKVLRDEAKVRDASAKVKQMEAHKRAADAEYRAALATVVLSRAMVKAKTAFRRYREKQLTRVKGLVLEKALDAKLEDEQEDFYLSALEGENAAVEQVNTSQEKASAAKEKITQAEADIDEAKAEVGVAEAELAHSRVLVSYCRITSPYNGIVTKRTFYPGKDGRYGAFIKSADQGGVSLFTVERNDFMRIVVQVPDPDVPYLSSASTAVVEIDALNGIHFEAAGKELHVSRWAHSEDKATRTMKTEIDIPNADGKLASGMYGRVTIKLGGASPNALRIPSSALFGKAEGGKGKVRIVRDGKAREVPVVYTTDNGVETEIIGGLKATDQVIIRSSAPLEEGMPVSVAASSSGH